MKRTENLTIVVLAISAAILITLLVGAYMGTPAYAGNASARYGNYIVAGAQTIQGQDILYVVDIPSRQMNLYRIDTLDVNKPNAPVNVIETISLDRLFAR